jgi:hypothetical protein
MRKENSSGKEEKLESAVDPTIPEPVLAHFLHTYRVRCPDLKLINEGYPNRLI